MIAFQIRPEQSADADLVGALVAAAFGSEGDTAQFVEAVRRQAHVPLAEVAVVAGAIVGQAQWCEAPVVVDGAVVKGAYLTCLSVAPDAQGRGVGSALVMSGLQRLRDLGYQVASLLGDPAYYGRFGFSSALAARIEAPHRSRGEGFQALELVAGALAGTMLRAEFPPAIAP